ncbi:MAG TPA: carboxypeptidase regulatory-like domain-containing protein [Bryobacteraceae bacterium]|nr:carboxypeptidase regulatory-like domain-containing protein [Bryobacteraceae bacterium]
MLNKKLTLAAAPLLLLTVLMLGLLTIQPVQAQVLYGSIVGTVEDPSGAVVPAAKVTLTHTATSTVREVVADDQGRFNAISLAAGTYDLSFTASGFRTLTRTGIEVTINTVTRVNAKLEVGQVSEQVTVSASAAALQTDRSDTRAEISSQTVVELPLPAVLAIQSGISKLRYATLMGIKKARSKPVQRITPEDLGGVPARQVEAARVYLPLHSKQTQMLGGSAQEAAAKLVEKLRFEARVL